MGKKRTVKLKPGEFELDGMKFDAWLVHLTAEPLISQHNLAIDQSTQCYVITADFLKDLTVAISQLGRGVSPQQALDAWRRAAEIIADYQKKNELVAELSYHYGFNATELDEEQQRGFKANLPRLLAQSRIENGQYDPTNIEGVYALYLRAYGDEDVAQRAATQAAWALIDERTAGARNASG